MQSFAVKNGRQSVNSAICWIRAVVVKSVPKNLSSIAAVGEGLFIRIAHGEIKNG
jgi:hypothetical protein